MKSNKNGAAEMVARRRLSRADRRRQLLDVARLIVREEGADRLTLGHLAVRAAVSKPVVYDHFATRSALLIELYRWIDQAQVMALQNAVTGDHQSLPETVQALAAAYLHCAADTNGEFYAVGAALAGSGEKASVFQELLDGCVLMFVSVFGPHSTVSPAELERRCVGLVGAGEALSTAMVRGHISEAQAAETFASIIQSALRVSPS
ncbi:TetR/AcrR family transcriptional regulator [Deinococcus frigens]|uniref:TetR/AcrR family transcriptional regulator n=1 Tax=Deinococcus frigens TaxID=249403 RepID=UPI0004950A4D|nr:TetR/AcrR family transcriptional regulator [Deinococcus frigens]